MSFPCLSHLSIKYDHRNGLVRAPITRMPDGGMRLRAVRARGRRARRSAHMRPRNAVPNAMTGAVRASSHAAIMAPLVVRRLHERAARADPCNRKPSLSVQHAASEQQETTAGVSAPRRGSDRATIAPGWRGSAGRPRVRPPQPPAHRGPHAGAWRAPACARGAGTRPARTHAPRQAPWGRNGAARRAAPARVLGEGGVRCECGLPFLLQEAGEQ